MKTKQVVDVMMVSVSNFFRASLIFCVLGSTSFAGNGGSAGVKGNSNRLTTRNSIAEQISLCGFNSSLDAKHLEKVRSMVGNDSQYRTCVYETEADLNEACSQNLRIYGSATTNQGCLVQREDATIVIRVFHGIQKSDLQKILESGSGLISGEVSRF